MLNIVHTWYSYDTHVHTHTHAYAHTNISYCKKFCMRRNYQGKEDVIDVIHTGIFLNLFLKNSRFQKIKH